MKSIIKKLVFGSSGRLFTLLMNLNYKIRGKPDRIKLIGQLYQLQCENTELNFFNEKQSGSELFNGWQRRRSKLNSYYHIDLIDFADGDIVIDCGANIGEIFHVIKDRNDSVNYIGIEPSLNEYLCLEKNSEESQNYNNALWHEQTTLDFYLSSDHADSAVHEPSKYDNVVRVEAITLSDVIAKNRIKFLKLEAEGAEPEVLKGAGDKLRNIEFISADLGFERGKKQTSTLPEVANILFANGFSLIKVEQSRLICLFKRV